MDKSPESTKAIWILYETWLIEVIPTNINNKLAGQSFETHSSQTYWNTQLPDVLTSDL